MIPPWKRAKVMIPLWKRAKHGNEDKQDRLSDLPDCVLLHILSSLDSKYAVQTCILSTRWKNLWKRVPTLILNWMNFSTHKKFARFVSKILTLRDISIALHALDLCHYGKIEPHLLKKILKYVSSHSAQLQELGIYLNGLTMSCVSSCQALTSLKVSLSPGSDIYNGRSGETLFPNYLNLPLLTNLDLTNFTFCGGESGCAEPFSVFTKLNSLVICDCIVKDAQILNISSETLVNLTMSYNSTDSDFDKIELSVPRLCNFSFTNELIQKICGSGLSSVKLVNIDAPCYSDSVENALVLLSWLQDLVSVESLRVTSTTLQILSVVPDLLEVKLHSFCNLNSLEIKLETIHDGSLYRSIRNAILKKVAAKSQKEADKLRKEFKAGLFPDPVPDGMVDFLRQNSPLAEVNLTTTVKGYYYLTKVEESKKDAKIIKSHSQFATPASSSAPAYGAESASAAAPPNFHLCHAEKMTTNSEKQKIQVEDHTSRKVSTSHQMGDALVARAQSRDKIVESSSSQITGDFSLTKCVVALEEIRDISNDIYGKVLVMFKDPDWREMFIAMSNDRRRGWLFRLQG